MISMSEYIHQTEANDGIRFSWNIWPMHSVPLEMRLITCNIIKLLANYSGDFTELSIIS